MEERGALERALPAPDHRHLPPREPREATVRRGVGRELRRQVGEGDRAPSERGNPRRDDDAPGPNHLAILQHHPEAVRIRVNPLDAPPVQVRHDLLPEPLSVRDEAVERHGPGDRAAARGLIGVEREGPVRIRDVGGGPVGAQEHPRRHLAPPEGHRLPEDTRLDARRAQVRARRQSVGARADDRHRTRCRHVPVPASSSPDTLDGSSAADNWTRCCVTPTCGPAVPRDQFDRGPA